MAETEAKGPEKGTTGKRGRGRPPGTTKLTPEIQEKIILAIKKGNYIETAAAYAGVNKDTLYSWLKQGAGQKKGVFRIFSDAVGQALAFSEARDLEVIEKAGQNGDWRAAAWRLERRFQNRWGQKERQEITFSAEPAGKDADSPFQPLIDAIDKIYGETEDSGQDSGGLGGELPDLTPGGAPSGPEERPEA